MLFWIVSHFSAVIKLNILKDEKGLREDIFDEGGTNAKIKPIDIDANYIDWPLRIRDALNILLRT